MSKCLWNYELIFLNSSSQLILAFYFYFKRLELKFANRLYENGYLLDWFFTMVLKQKCFCENLNCRLVFNCSAAMISSTTNQG